MWKGRRFQHLNMFPDLLGDLVLTRGHSRRCRLGSVVCRNYTDNISCAGLCKPGAFKSLEDPSFAGSAGDPRLNREQRILKQIPF